MAATVLMATSAGIVLALGVAHLLLTFWGPKLLPRDPDLRTAMAAVSPVITKQTTMWRAWLGFNASHSMGAILFGVVYGHLALERPELLFGSPFLLAVGLAMLLGYLALARAYWFRTPLAGVVLSLACYVAAVVLAAVSAPARAGENRSTERVEVASGEWRLVGDLVLPRAEQRVPAILLLNKAAGERTVYSVLAEELARRGIASLRLDLRGHGESTNLGRFVPSEGTEILDGTPLDVAAALKFLGSRSAIDAERIGVVGASYSGEKMMEAARANGYAAAYVGLSPGSLSDESIDAIDREGIPFLLVVSRHERWLEEVAAALRERSRSAHYLELDGSAHATELLDEHPELAGILAVWLERALVAPAGTGAH